VYLPGIRKAYPAVLDELEGIAKGADVHIHDIIMLNARYDLTRCRGKVQSASDSLGDNKTGKQPESEEANECTSVYISPEASATGDAFTAQNWDNAAHLTQNDTVIYLESHPSEDVPSTFALTEAGQLVRSGMNSNGLGLTANSLVTSADFVPISHTNPAGVSVHVESVPAIPISLLRRQFLESPTFARGFEVMQSGSRHVSMNVTVATSEGSGMCLEVTPDRIYRIHSDGGYVVHTNHFLHTGFLARSDIKDTYPGGSS
jgi:isopenicillin-N N-acyltransferase-like protein